MLFFCNDTATTEIYTLSLHDALPILCDAHVPRRPAAKLRSSFAPRPPAKSLRCAARIPSKRGPAAAGPQRSEEHTSELQSHHDLVCRLLLEKKKNNKRPDVSAKQPTA